MQDNCRLIGRTEGGGEEKVVVVGRQPLERIQSVGHYFIEVGQQAAFLAKLVESAWTVANLAVHFQVEQFLDEDNVVQAGEVVELRDAEVAVLT